MVPNIPGIPGPPLGGSSSGSSSPSGYNPHTDAKMVRANFFCLSMPDCGSLRPDAKLSLSVPMLKVFIQHITWAIVFTTNKHWLLRPSSSFINSLYFKYTCYPGIYKNTYFHNRLVGGWFED